MLYFLEDDYKGMEIFDTFEELQQAVDDLITELQHDEHYPSWRAIQIYCTDFVRITDLQLNTYLIDPDGSVIPGMNQLVVIPDAIVTDMVNRMFTYYQN